jgi:hypothetical protein
MANYNYSCQETVPKDQTSTTAAREAFSNKYTAIMVVQGKYADSWFTQTTKYRRLVFDPRRDPDEQDSNPNKRGADDQRKQTLETKNNGNQVESRDNVTTKFASLNKQAKERRKTNDLYAAEIFQKDFMETCSKLMSSLANNNSELVKEDSPESNHLLTLLTNVETTVNATKEHINNHHYPKQTEAGDTEGSSGFEYKFVSEDLRKVIEICIEANISIHNKKKTYVEQENQANSSQNSKPKTIKDIGIGHIISTLTDMPLLKKQGNNFPALESLTSFASKVVKDAVTQGELIPRKIKFQSEEGLEYDLFGNILFAVMEYIKEVRGPNAQLYKCRAALSTLFVCSAAQGRDVAFSHAMFKKAGLRILIDRDNSLGDILYINDNGPDQCIQKQIEHIVNWMQYLWKVTHISNTEPCFEIKPEFNMVLSASPVSEIIVYITAQVLSKLLEQAELKKELNNEGTIEKFKTLLDILNKFSDNLTSCITHYEPVVNKQGGSPISSAVLLARLREDINNLDKHKKNTLTSLVAHQTCIW